VVISKIKDAIEGFSGPEIVAYLATLDLDRPIQPPLSPSHPRRANPDNRPAQLGTGFLPGTWNEVEYLWDNNVIDTHTYMAAKRNYVANNARTATNGPPLRRRPMRYRRQPDRERDMQTGALPVMVCKGLLRGPQRRPYVVAWAPGAIWALNDDAASHDIVCLVLTSVGLAFAPTPTSADVRLDLDEPVSVAACLARSTTMCDMEGGPLLGPPLPPDCVG